MGEVLIKYKVMPEGPEVNLKVIAEKFAGYIPDHGRLSVSEIKPAFFGMSMLEITISCTSEPERSTGDLLLSSYTLVSRALFSL